jgi:hypothetical protein
MQALVIALLLQIMVVEYLIKSHGLLHPYAILLPELLSGIAMLVVLVRIMAGGRIAFDWRYGLFLAALLFTIVFGYLVQDVPDGAMLAGARSYLKFLPFFLLPLVHRFTPRQLHVQLMVLFVIALAETPLAFYQRFVEFADAMHTGDPVRGTLTTSSALSMFMVAAIGGAVAFYVRGRLRFAALVVVCAWLFAATTINETKATILLLPFALLVPVLLSGNKTRLLPKLVPIVGVGFLAVSAFVIAYNSFVRYSEYGGTLGEFFTNSEAMRYYLYTGAANLDQPYVGRFDSIEIALEYIRQDPFKLAFGYGAGNVSESFLPEFAGRYSDYFLRYGVGQTQVTTFLWELGVVGLLAHLFLLYAVARDALTLARSNDPAAHFGQIWTVVMVIATFGLVYKAVFSMNDFGYLFWYFSGVVASRAAAVRQKVVSRAAHAPPAWQLAAREPREAFKT